MSFGNLQKVYSGVQEVMVIAVMFASIFALFYLNDIVYKVSIVALGFSVIFLTTLATAILRQQRDAKKAQR